MCGIAGIVGAIDERNRSALARMTDALAHRGPDSAGFWTSSPDGRGHGCMLGHRRLSIIDLSSAADQPMTDPHTVAHTIVFNGEIYNFKALRHVLQSAGHSFQSTGDTAVMLRLLAIEGPAAVSRLRGMFAFALWDHNQRRLLMARDPLGIKPLYVCRSSNRDDGWSVLFSSEVRSILASGLLGRSRLNRRALASVVWSGFVMAPDTAVAGIESLRPGEMWVLDGDGRVMCAKQHWRMPVPNGQRTTEDELRETLIESVKLHLISDVPIGIFLSSGVDSSSVANLAQKSSDSPVHTFTLAFDEAGFDEGVYARRIASAIGTEHHEIRLTGQEFAAALDTAVDTLDQPTFDGLNSYFISKAVREAGLTVALAGTGGDELFGGYPSFNALPKMLWWERCSRLLPARAKLLVAELVRTMLAPNGHGSMPPQTRWAKLPEMVRAGDDLIALYQLAYAQFLPSFQGRLLLDKRVAEEMPSGLTGDVLNGLREEVDGTTPLSAVSILEQRLFLGERLLRDTDAASMAVSLETRLPLVDSVVAETATGLSDDQRFSHVGSKRMLRKIGLEGLDPALFDRPKSGFVLPFDRWIRQSLGRAMDETMRDETLARDVGLNGHAVASLWSAFQEQAAGLYWSRVWALYVLIRWCHRHRVFY